MSTGDDGNGFTGGSLVAPCRLATSISPYPPYVAGAATAAPATGAWSARDAVALGRWPPQTSQGGARLGGKGTLDE